MLICKNVKDDQTSIISDLEANILVSDGCISECSKSFADMTGYSFKSEIEGKRLSDIAPKFQEGWKPSEYRETELLNSLEKKLSKKFSWIFLHKNGSLIYARLEGRKVIYGNHFIFYIQVKPVQVVLHHTDESTVTTLINGIAHHVNTPLGNIITSSSYLLTSLDNIEERESQLRELLKIIQKSAEKIGFLIDEMKIMGSVNYKEEPIEVDITELDYWIRKELKITNWQIRYECISFRTNKTALLIALSKVFKFLKSRMSFDGDFSLITIENIEDHLCLYINCRDIVESLSMSETFKSPFLSESPGSPLGLELYLVGCIVRNTLKGSISFISDNDDNFIELVIPEL